MQLHGLSKISRQSVSRLSERDGSSAYCNATRFFPTTVLFSQTGVWLSAACADITGKMEQLKAARAKRGRVYNSVEEFMAERMMIIDLAMTRGQLLQVIQRLHGFLLLRHGAI